MRYRREFAAACEQVSREARKVARDGYVGNVSEISARRFDGTLYNYQRALLTLAAADLCRHPFTEQDRVMRRLAKITAKRVPRRAPLVDEPAPERSAF